MMNVIVLLRLSLIFEKHKFFESHDDVTPEYKLLLEIYNFLPQGARDYLSEKHEFYKTLPREKLEEAMRRIDNAEI